MDAVFTNSQVIRNNNDIMIGAAKVPQGEISYNNYILAVENRILKLVVHAVKDSMAEKAPRHTAISNIVTFIYSKLSFMEKHYPTDEEGIVKEIMSSEEFLNWSYNVWYNFKNIHAGVIQKDTPVPAHGALHPDINVNTIELIENEDSLEVIITGLAGTKFND